ATMQSRARTDMAQAFRRLHDRSRVLLLPNAWDALSARLFARRGFAAVATTSAGVAWSLGYADGEQAPLDEVLAAVARIVRAARVRAARTAADAAGVPIVINARVDHWMQHDGAEPAARLADAIERGRAYL